ncbi:hypothetical protein P4U43_04625 [Arthrobacter sp. EH-1B-1]|uniref:Integral membrane protein n=1 Tax=Arthrobacter vasquezii TaxID=2977629 RepID=A0ABT6CSL9_9MICC|nr:hypothetical protein [Arthrobacter vasquezii]MDF9277075.1 hypothetical protein [Arthrobacter vasquezii]
MRTAGSAFFVLFALMLGVVALPSAWLASNVVAEDGFVQLTAPLADDAKFTGTLAGALAEEATASVELPPGVANAVEPVVRDVAQGIAQLPDFDRAWQDTLRRSHGLTFGGQEQLDSDSGGPAVFTLDVAPLVGLVTAELGGQFGVDVPEPERTLVNIGGTDPFDLGERAETAADLWPALAIAAGVGAVLALVLARRRSTTLALLGLGILLTGGVLWITSGLVPGLANQVGDESAVADVFKAALAERAASSFQEWCLAALAAGILLLVAGVVGRLLSGSRR